MCQRVAGSGHVGLHKEFGFYSKCDEKMMQGFNQDNDSFYLHWTGWQGKSESSKPPKKLPWQPNWEMTGTWVRLMAVEQSGQPTIYSVSRTNGAVYVRGMGNRDIKVYSSKKYVPKLWSNHSKTINGSQLPKEGCSNSLPWPSPSLPSQPSLFIFTHDML